MWPLTQFLNQLWKGKIEKEKIQALFYFAIAMYALVLIPIFGIIILAFLKGEMSFGELLLFSLGLVVICLLQMLPIYYIYRKTMLSNSTPGGT